MSPKAQSILRSVFGYDSFRPLQEEIIQNILKKEDTLVIMPTGGGKSLCYQIPALLFDGLTIVVSPLISLMKDQVDQLIEYGVSAVVLNSSISKEKYQENVEKLQNGEAKMLYIAPESLLMKSTLDILKDIRVDCFTIDEAHCISEWGHDFRKEYRRLADLRKTFPEAVCVALTATATPRVRDDIKKILDFDQADTSRTYIASFDRKNLFLNIVDKVKPLDQILDFLYTRKNQSGIIYCFSRRQTNELYQDLRKNGISVRPYHAGLPEEVREDNQNAFIRDEVDVIVATVAFGMGIDKPDVRFVIHHDMPQNIESYYQQIGRAGRDGLRSECLLLYSYSDRQKINYFINQKEGDEKDIATRHLQDLLRYLQTTECRRIPLMSYFGEVYEQVDCEMCDNCTRDKEKKEDVTEQAALFLATAASTNEKFGAGQLVLILRGSKSKKVLEQGHHELEQYGKGAEQSAEEWNQLSRLLLRQEMIAKDPEYGSLKITERGRSVLKGELRVLGVMDRTKAQSRPSGSSSSNSVEDKYNKDLFERLRMVRKDMAHELFLPPYVIFPDVTLMEMAYYYPKTAQSMLKMHGVGEVKMERYGDRFLTAIRDYCKNHSLEEKPKEATFGSGLMEDGAGYQGAGSAQNGYGANGHGVNGNGAHGMGANGMGANGMGANGTQSNGAGGIHTTSGGHGSNGHSGTNGHAGANGHVGTNGHTGKNGHVGANGHVGVNGHEGTNSHASANGHTGSNGHTSANGRTGSNSHAGTNGQAGTNGNGQSGSPIHHGSGQQADAMSPNGSHSMNGAGIPNEQTGHANQPNGNGLHKNGASANGNQETLSDPHQPLEQHQMVGLAFNNGKSLIGLAEEYGVREATILSDLIKFHKEGNPLRLDGILESCHLSERMVAKVMRAMDNHGSDQLRDVYLALNEEVNYLELRKLQLYYDLR